MPKLPSTHVHPLGDPRTAKYIIIGDYPRKMDILNNRAFSSPYGVELDSNLRMAEIPRSECYFTYVIKDRDTPIGSKISFTRKGPAISTSGEACLTQLKEELSTCTSNIIIALGNFSLFAVASRTGVTKWRGSIIESTLLPDKLVIPSNHPETIVPHKDLKTGKWMKGQYTNKRLLIYDLKRAKTTSDQGHHPLSRNILIRPTFTQSLDFLQTCYTKGLAGEIIFYDIEVDVFNGEMTCISFAYSPTEVISIPFIYEGGDYFTIPQEAEIMLKITELLEAPLIPIGGQNLSFDCTYMLRKYGIHTTSIHDTMVAQKTILPDYPVGLHFICSLYTDLPYYKEDGKYWLGGAGSWDGGWNYNALDSVVCADAYPKQLTDLHKQGNYLTYKHKSLSVLPYVYMMEHGIKINLGSMQQAYNEKGKDLDSILFKLHALCGFPLNPNSPKQVAEYFYTTKGLPAYRFNGKPSVNEKALKRISRKGHQEASLILSLRSLSKERATFLNPAKVDPDSRMRCSYNPVGTRYARASSSENIFGMGNNLQNQPHKVLIHFITDPYDVFYGMDLSQAENRIVAYEGRIAQMIECFETGQDVHGLTAKIMINIFFGPEKGKSIGIKDYAPIGDGKKTWRDWGKRANHGLNYDLGFKNFALGNEIPDRDGKTIVDIYHAAYPGVRGGFHAYVKKNINRNRTLTNLLGRKTIFTDRIDDALFKEAYACIPQGTVGDIIDQRGLNFIYFNPDPLFRYVELLIQVHDQIGFQIPTPYHPEHPLSWEEHSKILTKIKASLEIPLRTHYDHEFVIPVDTMMGVTLNKNVGKDLDSLDPTYLEKSYQEVTKKWLPMKT